MSQVNNTRIFIVDDHPIVRHGLRELLSQEPEFEVCGEASNCHDALSFVKKESPDLMIVDIRLEGSSGIELIQEIRRLGMTLPIIVLSVHNENTYAVRAFKAGANGYIIKNEAPRMVVECIHKVKSGEMYISQSMTANLLKAFSRSGNTSDDPLACLSNRELQIFDLIGQGKIVKEIASLLNLSTSTVESHRASIRDKLKIPSSAELSHYATVWVLVHG